MVCCCNKSTGYWCHIHWFSKERLFKKCSNFFQENFYCVGQFSPSLARLKSWTKPREEKDQTKILFLVRCQHFHLSHFSSTFIRQGVCSEICRVLLLIFPSLVLSLMVPRLWNFRDSFCSWTKMSSWDKDRSMWGFWECGGLDLPFTASSALAILILRTNSLYGI